MYECKCYIDGQWLWGWNVGDVGKEYISFFHTDTEEMYNVHINDVVYGRKGE